jgi:hypothetical protein
MVSSIVEYGASIWEPEITLASILYKIEHVGFFWG